MTPPSGSEAGCWGWERGGRAPQAAPSQEKLLEDSYSPVMLAKAVKNSKEQELLRAAHVRAVPSSSPPGRRFFGGGADADGAVPRSGTRWPSSSTCCGWSRRCRRGRWTSFWVPATSMPSDGQCRRTWGGGGAQGARDPPRHLSLSPLAAFQGPAAQPRAQLRVHLRQRAQCGARPLQVWGRGLGDTELEGVPGTSNPPLLLPSPSNTTRRKLSVDEMYLADTGGQYLCVSHPLPPSHPAPSPVGFGAHVPPSAGMAPRTSHGPCTGARRPRCRRCWHHGAVPATELGLWPEAGCVEGGDGDIPSAPRSAPSPCHL